MHLHHELAESPQDEAFVRSLAHAADNTNLSFPPLALVESVADAQLAGCKIRRLHLIIVDLGQWLSCSGIWNQERPPNVPPQWNHRGTGRRCIVDDLSMDMLWIARIFLVTSCGGNAQIKGTFGCWSRKHLNTLTSAASFLKPLAAQRFCDTCSTGTAQCSKCSSRGLWTTGVRPFQWLAYFVRSGQSSWVD